MVSINTSLILSLEASVLGGKREVTAPSLEAYGPRHWLATTDVHSGPEAGAPHGLRFHQDHSRQQPYC
jgi:hypothetical protein